MAEDADRGRHQRHLADGKRLGDVTAFGKPGIEIREEHQEIGEGKAPDKDPDDSHRGWRALPKPIAIKMADGRPQSLLRFLAHCSIPASLRSFCSSTW